jgi:hypothetical protein
MIRVLHSASRMPAPGYEAEQHHDQRDHQEEMNYPTQRVAAYETKQPQNEQDYRNCV